ncbi:hypothetical protein [Streptomyces spectabilis]|uniref:Sigma-like protein n=1 Tax=Streptomyces spectabilis TaxID=68270 RepID=A0A5P2XC49_STRST|nr:hypothetical protein [Streptomyces spectabilis]MBB5106765.1 hypothetical protein [Streptomyces spectabilis]MCI3903383.1 hypothetical protein [Streptomyces spectabilis]QEV60600.1 hypothetical protein CP982_19270 [Streptomyces spectabilis]GGV43711.1 hypothetical protein GCM10010245_68530 [Streptomyces spectabilis]
MSDNKKKKVLKPMGDGHMPAPPEDGPIVPTGDGHMPTPPKGGATTKGDGHMPAPPTKDA